MDKFEVPFGTCLKLTDDDTREISVAENGVFIACINENYNIK